jgi:threonylcarbamoyladenosine tRNA methylthiotransferase MtaB
LSLVTVRIFLRTFGCRANHADSEAVRAMALAAGHEMVDTPEGADVAVFNSCAVTTDAEADLRQAVRRAARAAPSIRSVVMGCVAGLADRRDALRALPSVTEVVAAADLPRIAAALGIHNSPSQSASPVNIAQQSTRGLLRIQDGCDEHCTFCTTRLARGTNRSVPEEALVRAAQSLADHHPEIVLTGVHIGTYGADIGTSLCALLYRLARDVPAVRFRVSSIEATEVDEALTDLLTGDARRVAPSLHAPLQSGSDRVLRHMGRHWYTADAYARAIEHLVGRSTVFGLGADVIAGFPDETDADHEATVALCERLPFAYLHVFPFSARPGTPAARMPGQLSPGVIAERAAELRALGSRKRAEYEAARAGATADVVVVGAAGRRMGVTEDHLTVNLADPAKPRGTRFQATLCREGGLLVAH